MTKIGVVIPILNGFQDAVIALSRIQSQKGYSWQPYIAKQWRDKKSISEAWNVQSNIAFKDDCDYVLIINDDSWLFPNTLDKLVDHMFETEVLLVSGTNSHVDEYEPQVTGIGAHAGLDFSCFLIRERTLRVVGYFDQNFYPAYLEDNDYHYRIKLAGYDAYGLADALFYHKDDGSNTINRLDPSERERFDKNFKACRYYFINKWGGLPDTEGLYTTPYNEGGSIKTWKIPR